MPVDCDAKIRPFPNDTELRCEVTDAPDHDEHHATLRDYAYPGSSSVIHWWEGDRRTFRGDWAPCPEDGCILPAGHAGNDAF